LLASLPPPRAGPSVGGSVFTSPLEGICHHFITSQDGYIEQKELELSDEFELPRDEITEMRARNHILHG
jgi:hypothetical protein